MLYLKYFILYSIIGFTFESDVFKISKSLSHSGIIFGPYTIVYGFGGLASLVINKLLNCIDNIYLNFITCYFLFTISCSLIEFISGHIINYLFKKDSWNYSNHKYHFGKYVCLDYSLFWGLLATIFTKVLQNFFHYILAPIPSYIVIIFLLIIVVDFFLSLLKKDYLSK